MTSRNDTCRHDRSGRQSPGIVSKAPAAIAAGFGKSEKGCGMVPSTRELALSRINPFTYRRPSPVARARSGERE